MSAANEDLAALLEPWRGPCGGLPPFDRASPDTIARAYKAAVLLKRAQVEEIAGNPTPPSFENTIAALEDSGRELRRIDALYRVYAATMSTPGMQTVAEQLSSLAAALEDEIAHDSSVFARVRHVHGLRKSVGLSPEQIRLTEVMYERLVRRGAALSHDAQQRLKDLHSRLAELFARFNRNLIAEQDSQALFLQHPEVLEGLTAEQRSAAAAAAVQRARPGQWAIPNVRPAVWSFLTHAARRDLRERVWRMWVSRGANPGEYDNRPIIDEMLRLRGEKAKLLGYPSFAHFALAERMLGRPEAVAVLLDEVWRHVISSTRAQLAELQALAAEDDPTIRLEPWDRLYYTEKLRRRRFGLDAEAVRPYLALESVIAAMLDAAGRLHGLTFSHLSGAPTCDPTVQVLEVRRQDEPLGVLYLDLYARPGKMPGSWQQEYRAAEGFRGRVLPISSINSSIPRPPPGEPALLTWEVANVLFHELGHALHILSCKASYPSLGSMRVAWDFVELPSLLNERWLRDRTLLKRFARHHLTGEPIPESLIERIEQGARFDRVFSVTLEYLSTALVDLRAHLLADGRKIDATRLETGVLSEIGMPQALDPTLRLPHAYHTFSDDYAAGVYVYLWSDVMAADVAEAFMQAPDALYDAEVAARWRETILEVGHSIPAARAFRSFRGRDPDMTPLLRRFGLTETP
ncbi:MAG TPA: M3 family metallopeptidase [Steroidobacteraceae bacterium]|nr:M3 family metallopeptidase [Steroidobacteraceae bacterium]